MTEECVFCGEPLEGDKTHVCVEGDCAHTSCIADPGGEVV